MKLVKPLYSVYERNLAASIPSERLPHHVGVMVDGNRRWAALMGQTTKHGHQKGAERIIEFLGWCRELGIDVVTLYMLSTENLKRPASELGDLVGVIDDLLRELGESRIARLQPVGALNLLPDGLPETVASVTEQTADVEGLHVNIAVGYGGRQEIVDSVRELLSDAAREGRDISEVAESLTADDISSYLYTRGQPDPDLVIRTSGEQRLSGFMVWQSAYSEFYFCEALWPDFRRVDFLRALRDYAGRQRRFGS
ncbi:isoprenyl transferase [Kocuria koreensis]|jgi:short-chain Z-isoprenyl diphosphate synthase|uniref:Isoprenyl transferase n=1 Tax=Rothia koreensis TaxID=592378 RepID=A0A7K1LIB5_9MICC|nr:isoprenyl transferase [Rothia koreensis]MUN54937.1 isoprenyl transferase [Rothia koreensis]